MMLVQQLALVVRVVEAMVFLLLKEAMPPLLVWVNLELVVAEVVLDAQMMRCQKVVPAARVL
jgi:hypothetical protein